MTQVTQVEVTQVEVGVNQPATYDWEVRNLEKATRAANLELRGAVAGFTHGQGDSHNLKI